MCIFGLIWRCNRLLINEWRTIMQIKTKHAQWRISCVQLKNIHIIVSNGFQMVVFTHLKSEKYLALIYTSWFQSSSKSSGTPISLHNGDVTRFTSRSAVRWGSKQHSAGRTTRRRKVQHAAVANITVGVHFVYSLSSLVLMFCHSCVRAGEEYVTF